MIQSAKADQEGKTKRYEADVTIAQSLRDKEMKQAEFNAAVQAKTAEAAQAGPLATATARQRVTEQETRIDQVRKQQEVLVQEQEAARKEKELLATVVRPAEAQRQAAIVQAEGEKQATVIKAEGAKQATVIKAEATQKELEYEGAGEASKIEKVGRAEAAKVLAIGEAEAEVVKKKLLAEAEGLQRKAEAWKNFNEAAVLNMIVDKMPELAQAFATQLAGIDKINIIDMGGGDDAGGVGRLMGTVGGGMTAMLAMLKDQFGIDVTRLVAAKTEAAATQAEAAGPARLPRSERRTAMADSVVYQSAEPWDAERPQTLVISCVDGRWRPYIQEFLTELRRDLAPHGLHGRAGRRRAAHAGRSDPEGLQLLPAADRGARRRPRHAPRHLHRPPGLLVVRRAEDRAGHDRPPGAAAARPAPRGGLDARDVPEHPRRDVLRAPARRRRRTREGGVRGGVESAHAACW